MGVFKAQLHGFLPYSFSMSSLFKMPLRTNWDMVGRFLSLLEEFRGKEKKGLGVSPAQHPEELDPFQPKQDGEWQSWATGLMAAASLAPSHPCNPCPGCRGPCSLCG